jgi:proteic killer suppression protein
MIRSFADQATEDIFNGKNSRVARRALPRNLIRIALRKLEQLDSVERLEDLRIPPGNRLEAVKDDRSGQHSIRINEQYRVCFTWSDSGPEAVEVVDYH